MVGEEVVVVVVMTVVMTVVVVEVVEVEVVVAVVLDSSVGLSGRFSVVDDVDDNDEEVTGVSVLLWMISTEIGI